MYGYLLNLLTRLRDRDNIRGYFFLSHLFSSPFDKELSNFNMTASKASTAECTKHNSSSECGGVVLLKGRMCWQFFGVVHHSEIRNNIKDPAVMSVCLYEGSVLWQQKQTSFWFVNLPKNTYAKILVIIHIIQGKKHEC